MRSLAACSERSAYPGAVEDCSELASPAIEVRLVKVLGAGAESDRVGVAIGRRNIGEPKFMRYCGPTGKFVSCAEEIPSRASSRKKRLAERIPTSLRIVSLPSPIMRGKRMKCQSRKTPDPA